MRLKDIVHINDPWARLIQSHEFLMLLLETEDRVREIRDEALLEAREDNPRLSQQFVADCLRVKRQHITRMERQGKERRKIKAENPEREWMPQ